MSATETRRHGEGILQSHQPQCLGALCGEGDFFARKEELKSTEFSDEGEGSERLFVGRYPLLYE